MAQDFQRQNLQGYSFKGQDLTDANFSHCEIQGVDFTNAILIGANFSNAQTGVPSGWTTSLAIISFILATTSGFLTALIGGGAIGIIFKFGELPITFFTVVMLAIFTVFVVFINSRGLGAAIWALTAALPVTMVVILGMSLVGGLSGFVPGKSVTVVAIAFVGGIVGAIAAVMSLTGAIFFATSVTIAGVVCRSAAIIVAVAGAVSMVLATVGTVPMAMAQSGGNLFSTDGMIAVNQIIAEFLNDKITATETWAKIFALAGAGVSTATALAMITVTLPALVLGSYIAGRTLAGDLHYNFILRIAVNLASTRGTNFQEANLTDANFTNAVLKSTDFRKANLTRTCWRKTKKLERARLDGTYLEDFQIRQLLITGEGRDRNFDNRNLEGINLLGANLANTRFIGANLCKANLQQADLSGAILVRSQLELANLTGANLTGACIENWGITKTTKLDKIICEYIFLSFINGDKRNRIPEASKGEFSEGEFTQFVASILDSFDLFQNRDLNPKAAISTLQGLADKYQEPIEIVGLENRDNNIVFKFKTSDVAKTEQIQREYQYRYNQTLSLSLLDNSMDLLPQYREIESRMSELIEEVKQPRATHIKYLHNEGIVITGGNVRANVNQFSDYPQIEQSSIAELLTQLQAEISTTTELTAEEKAIALEQVKILGNAAKNHVNNVVVQKQAKTAIRVLRGTISGLSTTTNLRRENERLLRAIAQFFNLG